MKKIIYIDNDRQKEAEDNFRTAQRRLSMRGGVDTKLLTDITPVGSLHNSSFDIQEVLSEKDIAIITYSMFTENHFGSYGQLVYFLVYAGMADVKEQVYINTSSYLKYSIERLIQNESQSIYCVRAIANNFIIHYNDDDNTFYRLVFDLDAEDFISMTPVILTDLLT